MAVCGSCDARDGERIRSRELSRTGLARVCGDLRLSGGWVADGCVERAQRTHTEEFYEVNDFSLEMAPLNRELLAWERIYNTVRPHQPSATSPHINSSLAGYPTKKRSCVTHLLDEYMGFTLYRFSL